MKAAERRGTRECPRRRHEPRVSRRGTSVDPALLATPLSSTIRASHHLPSAPFLNPAALLTGRVASSASQDGLHPCSRLPARLQPGETAAQALLSSGPGLAPPGPLHTSLLSPRTLEARARALSLIYLISTLGLTLLPPCHAGYLCPFLTLSPHRHTHLSPVSFPSLV